MWRWLKSCFDSGFFQRRIAYYTILYITYYSAMQSWDFVREAPELGYEGVEVAAILAAIWAPITTLQGYIFNKFKELEIKREG